MGTKHTREKAQAPPLAKPQPRRERPVDTPLKVQAKHRRLERLREVQRTAILEAAEEVFAAKGFQEAKMTDIARRAGFSTGSLYNYFGGKEEIFLTLLADQLAGLWDMLDAQLERAVTFLELIGRATSVYAEFMDEHRRLFLIIHRTFPALVWGPTSANAPDTLATLMNVKGDIYQRFTDLVMRILKRGMEEGVLRPLDPRPLAVMLIGMMDSVNQLWLAQEPPLPFAQTLPSVLDIFLNGVCLRPVPPDGAAT